MKDIQEYEGYKFIKGSVTKVTDPLSVEAPLQISINGESFTVVMRTPGDEYELATGLLYAENVIIDFSSVKWEQKLDKYGRIEELNIIIDPELVQSGYLSARSLLSVSSCGICGKKELGDLMPNEKGLKQGLTISMHALFDMFENMKKQQKAFNITGGCHGIAAFNEKGDLLCIKEDIGRHNALDKVVGALIMSDKLNDAKIVTFSGRTSYEMISKSFRAKIPIIASVSAPSSLAIDFAKEYGITLIGFTRENYATCYANPARIIVQ